MRLTLFSLYLIAVLSGCANPPPPQSTRIPVGVVTGKVKTIDFSGLTGSKPFVIVGVAYVTISEPAFLKGKELEVWSSEDYPFRVGDEVEFVSPRIDDGTPEFPTSIAHLRDYSDQMRGSGFHVLNYFNVGQFGFGLNTDAPPVRKLSDADLWRDRR